MDPTVVTVIVVAVLVLLVVGALALVRQRKQAAERSEHLQQRFGPEYDHAVDSADDRREAETRLQRVERQRDELDIRPLSAQSRRERTVQWEAVQSRFVDAPVEAVDDADRLVADVMAERGYPTGDVEDKLTMLATDHAGTVEHYRTAEAHRDRFHSGEGSTEDLRRAFVEYRRLFEVLVADGADETGGTVTRPDDPDEPDDARAGSSVADQDGRTARLEDGR